MSVLRLFIATDPDDDLKKRIGEIIGSLKAPKDGVKWVRPDGIHLTIKFFGSVDEEEIPKISQGGSMVGRTIDKIGIYA